VKKLFHSLRRWAAAKARSKESVDPRLPGCYYRQPFDNEEYRREKEKWDKLLPDPEPTGKACPLCGGELVLVILNYYRDEITDVFTPADKAEKCASCGKVVRFL
jgi:uncharacterized protein with PIN domain